jgi:hypothetical protein
VVAGAVIAANSLGPVWGGLSSTFPAVYLSTMFLITKSRGPEFARATGKMMLASAPNLIIYSLAVNITYPILGIIAGTIVSYSCAAAFAALVYSFTKKFA